MANLAVTYTLVDGTVGFATYWNTNYSDIVTYINNRNSGSATWDILKISSTSANALDVTSSASGSTELSINNSATDGDPELTFKLSGAQTHIIGVDDSDSDFLKFATTGITTNVAMQIPTVGAQVQFASGSAALPGISFLSDIGTDSGIYLAGSNTLGFSTGGTLRWTLNSSGSFNGATGSTITADAGSAAAPVYSFDADTDTGGYRSGANVFSIAAGGAEIARFSASATLVSVIGSNNFAIPATQRIFLDGGGNTYIAESSADTLDSVVGNATALRLDTSATATHTRMLVYDVDNATLERVTVGAADSGGAGFKVLRIPN